MGLEIHKHRMHVPMIYLTFEIIMITNTIQPELLASLIIGNLL